jgi:parvulin-like peptidyl-prolyl isomerase
MPCFPSRFLLPALLAFAWAGAADAQALDAANPAPATSQGAPPAAGKPAAPGAADQPGKPAKPKGPKAGKASKSPGAVVITVGTSKITRSQIDTLVDLMVKARHQGATETQPGEKEYLGKMIATNLIGQQLLDLESKRLNVVADQKSLDSLAQVFRSNFPNDEAFKQALRQAGDTEAGLREKMARQIKADKLLSAQMAPVDRPAEKDLKDFFASHKAAFPVNDSLRACQILFMIEPNTPAGEIAKKKSELEMIRADLAKDTGRIDALLARFVMKAREVSDGPEKKDGGDLQRFLPGDFNPEFKKQASALKVGQMSPVFRTPLGWHLLILTERNDGKFESYRLQITRALVSEKAAKAGKDLKKYLQTLAERYKVTYLEDGYRDSTVAGVYDH